MVVSNIYIYILPVDSSLVGEMIQFDEHIFRMGWFNHQLDNMLSFWDLFFVLDDLGLMQENQH